MEKKNQLCKLLLNCADLGRNDRAVRVLLDGLKDDDDRDVIMNELSNDDRKLVRAIYYNAVMCQWVIE